MLPDYISPHRMAANPANVANTGVEPVLPDRESGDLPIVEFAVVRGTGHGAASGTRESNPVSPDPKSGGLPSAPYPV